MCGGVILDGPGEVIRDAPQYSLLVLRGAQEKCQAGLRAAGSRPLSR